MTRQVNDISNSFFTQMYGEIEQASRDILEKIERGDQYDVKCSIKIICDEDTGDRIIGWELYSKKKQNTNKIRQTINADLRQVSMDTPDEG